jgi:hypothetical protein
MEVTKPYKFIGFGAMDVTKPYNFIGFVVGVPDETPLSWADSGSESRAGFRSAFGRFGP